MAYKTDELRYAIYARHGDMCSCERDGVRDCGTGRAYDDYVLVARFVFLTEAIDYAQAVSTGDRGVRVRLRSRRYGPQAVYDVSSYPFASSAETGKAHEIAAHVTSTAQ